jgi:hypothetical protein
MSAHLIFSIFTLEKYLVRFTNHLAILYAQSHIPFSLLRLHQCISSGPRLTLWPYRNRIRFYGEELLAHCPTPKAVGSTLFGRPQLFIPHILSYPPYWRPFLHPQPEDAPFRGDMYPVITGRHWITVLIGARHNLIMCPVNILSGFITVHLECSLLLNSHPPSIVCPRCVLVYRTDIGILW